MEKQSDYTKKLWHFDLRREKNHKRIPKTVEHIYSFRTLIKCGKTMILWKNQSCCIQKLSHYIEKMKLRFTKGKNNMVLNHKVLNKYIALEL